MTPDQSEPSAPVEKRCSTCGTVKPLDCFHKNRTNGDGLQRACKPCMIALTGTPTAREKQRERMRERMRKARLDPDFRAKENARNRQRYHAKRQAASA